jgi:hypothetical protein
VTKEFEHEALAETLHLGVGLALGIEIRPALATAHGQGGQGILENLLKGQKFEYAQIDRRMKTDSALVGTDGAVHLHPETPVDMHFALIVHPRHAEDDDPLRLDHALDNPCPAVLGIALQGRFYGLHDLGHGLVKLHFARIPPLDQLKNLHAHESPPQSGLLPKTLWIFPLPCDLQILNFSKQSCHPSSPKRSQGQAGASFFS